MCAKTYFNEFWFPSKGGGGGGAHVWKAWCRIGLARRKRQLKQQYPTYFCCNKDSSGAMLLICYGTSFLTFCQISGLKEAFKRLLRTKLPENLRFRSMHLIGQKIFTILRLRIFPATEICAELCCQSTWGHLPQLSICQV